MDILHLIDRLESLVGSSRKIPLVSRVVMDEQRLLDMIDQMRVSVPEDVKEAKNILQERESILTEALNEAKRITAAAEEEAEAKIRDSEIVKGAEDRARQILSEAERQAEALLTEAKGQALATKGEADRYSLEVLRQVDTQLTGFLSSVRKGIKSLEGGKGSQ